MWQGAAALPSSIATSEPRGHADVYGGFVVPPDDAGTHLGVLFWHEDGSSTTCGHGTIALRVRAVDTGLVAAPDTDSMDLVIDVPSGRLPSGTVLRRDSIVGSTFAGTVLGTVDVAGRRAVLPQVTGMAYRTGEHRFVVDPHDALVPGFVLR
ncbi:proline racemase family protein [Geodermatophilus sp. URMC 60]